MAVTAATVLSAVVRPCSLARRVGAMGEGGMTCFDGRALRRRLAREEGGHRVLGAVAEVAGDDRVAGEGHGDELGARDPRGDAGGVLDAGCAGRSRPRG